MRAVIALLDNSRSLDSKETASLAKFILNVIVRKAVLNCYLDSFTKPRVVERRLIFGICILRIIVKQPKVINWLNMGLVK